VKRTITLAVEVANDDEYADVIQRAHALNHVIDMQWTTQNKGPHKGQTERVADLVEKGSLGFTSAGVHPYESSATFAELNGEVADEEEAEREATDLEVKELADLVVEMITEGALDPQFDRIAEAVDERLQREVDEQKTAETGPVRIN